MGFWAQHQAGLIVFLTALLFIAGSNLLLLPKLENYQSLDHWPRIFVLIPARNEADNIGPCVRSLLAQEYPNYEILVLDDHSTDGTSLVLEKILVESQAQDNRRLRWFQGKELPEGWLGKHWACHQLAQAADGELLLFTDADTRHHPLALRNAAAALTSEQAHLLSALPYEEVVSWGERLVIPIISWSIFAFLPVGLAWRLSRPFLSAAIGQYMLFEKDAYWKIGGHAAVRSHPADDLALARRVVGQGMRLRWIDGSQRIRCRMYRDFQQTFDGLSRTLFAAFDYHPWLFLLIWIWLGIVFLEPLAVLALDFAGFPLPGFSPLLAATGVALSLFLWGIFCWRFKYPLFQAFLYPATILLAVTIAMHSFYLAKLGKVQWKGRTLSYNEKRGPQADA